MIEEGTGHAYLIECDPRPAQITHLAPLAGVDLCGALAAELKGERPAEPLRATRDAESVLFPQEWLRRGEGPEIGRLYRDAPFDDPPLLDFMLRLGKRR